MPSDCPYCRDKCTNRRTSGTHFVRFGFFYRTGDSRWIQRFRCQSCGVTCSRATFNRWFRHKKRLKNLALKKHFASSGTIRRAARTFSLNRKTVARKLEILGFEAECNLRMDNISHPKCRVIEFDDLETFEHSKCKPISVTLAVEHRSRRILGIEVSRMPAKGLLVKRAHKYGPRADERHLGRKRLFKGLKDLVTENVVIKSDMNPHYTKDVKRYFPSAKHKVYEGKRGSLGGQGELKKVKFDPLFSLNHTCGMLRANISRLVRKTWCTTKRIDRLHAHLMVYATYHNEYLTK